ncbi:MAG: hypothetical protein HXK71_04670 [Clostridiales bacterium]|nr:hypothetical protein [Clostridiales bacterium]
MNKQRNLKIVNIIFLLILTVLAIIAFVSKDINSIIFGLIVGFFLQFELFLTSNEDNLKMNRQLFIATWGLTLALLSNLFRAI